MAPATRKFSSKIQATPQTTTPITTPTKPRSFYIERLYNVPQKLGLSKNAQILLKTLDDVELGLIEEIDLGRMIRLSPSLRQTIPDTISQCTDVMTNIPSETSTCVHLIQKCTQLLKIADRLPPKDTVFPFFKLPLEIRTQIYDVSFGKHTPIIFQPYPPRPTSWSSTQSCPSGSCPQGEGDANKPLDLSIVRTSSRTRDEALPTLYRNRQLAFSCTCNMNICLRTNTFVRANASNIRFHWRGQDAELAIPRLMACPNLTILTVRISKMTTYLVTPRETKMRQFFRVQKTNPRLSDAKGIEELLRVKGLDGVFVQHAPGKVASKRTEEEKWALQMLLDSELKQKKGVGYGQTGGGSA